MDKIFQMKKIYLILEIKKIVIQKECRENKLSQENLFSKQDA